MLRDAYDLDVTTTSRETIAAIDVYAADWIGHGKRLRTIFDAADADPDCALVNAQAAAVHMALEAASGFVSARRYLKRARATARGASEREQLFVSAVVAWANGDTPRTVAQLRLLIQRFPRDIAAAKWAQYHAFNLGEPALMLSLAESIMTAHARTAEAWSMRAFALSQNCRLGESENAARHALSLKRSDAWAHHALVHVLEAQDRIGEGIEFLNAYAHTWADRSIFIREHNLWHLALLHIDRDEPAQALKLFDDHLWGEWPEFAQEQIGAISALWRLEMRGVNVGERWAPIVAQVLARWHEHILPFHDIHFIYALARGGYPAEARAFLASLARRGARDVRGVWDGVALPLAQGVAAYAQGKFEVAANLIAPLLSQLGRIGGSHTQRDVFVQVWIDAALKAGQYSAAGVVLERRAKDRPSVRATRRMLDRARAGSSLASRVSA